MNFIITFLLAVVGLIVLLLIVALFRKKEHFVKRKIIITGFLATGIRFFSFGFGNIKFLEVRIPLFFFFGFLPLIRSIFHSIIVIIVALLCFG